LAQLLKRNISVSMFKHVTHVFNLTDIPITNRLVKISTTVKHITHASDSADVPIFNGLIELASTAKHVLK